MWWDSMTTRQLTTHYRRSHQQEPAPVLVLVGGDGWTPAPFMDPADRRRYTLQHSCWMVQGSSSWPLWVDATDLCCLRDLMMMMMSRSATSHISVPNYSASSGCAAQHRCKNVKCMCAWLSDPISCAPDLEANPLVLLAFTQSCRFSSIWLKFKISNYAIGALTLLVGW